MTNVISEPLVTVITEIGFDHVGMLGDTLAEIAVAKAGIIKNGVPIVSESTESEANAAALSEAELYFFPRQRFVALLEKNSSLALNMLAVLAMRLRRFATQIEHLTLREVPGRLAMYLLYMAREQKNMQQVALDIPKGQLASLLGTSPETLSRIFQKMSEEGLIQVEGKRILLLDPEALAER